MHHYEIVLKNNNRKLSIRKIIKFTLKINCCGERVEDTGKCPTLSLFLCFVKERKREREMYVEHKFISCKIFIN